MQELEDEPPVVEVTEDKKPEVKAAKTAKNPNELSGKKVWIVVDEPNNAPSTQQFFGLNGRGYLITFGEKVLVPVELCNVLDELIQTKTIPLAEGGFTERDFLRFPYHVVNQKG